MTFTIFVHIDWFLSLAQKDVLESMKANVLFSYWLDLEQLKTELRTKGIGWLESVSDSKISPINVFNHQIIVLIEYPFRLYQ